MAGMSLKDVSKALADIDFVMLVTRTDGGALAGRPMSNNRDVEYDGDSFYFAWDSSRTVTDIERDPTVGLAVQGAKGLLGAPPLFIHIEGRGEIIRDKGQFRAHWTPDLERWFKDGVDTPGLALIKVHAGRIHYWSGEDEGEITV